MLETQKDLNETDKTTDTVLLMCFGVTGSPVVKSTLTSRDKVLKNNLTLLI